MATRDEDYQVMDTNKPSATAIMNPEDEYQNAINFDGKQYVSTEGFSCLVA